MSQARVVRSGDPARALVDLPDGYRAVAPPHWARRLGARSIPLGALALDAVERHGWRVASRLVSWRSLGEAVADEVGSADMAAWRRALAGPVAALVQAGVGAPSGPALALPDGLSSASRRAWRVAERHAAALAREGLLDPAAVLAVASGVPRSDEAPVPWLVATPIGPTPEEARFVASVAPPGSIVVAPADAVDARRRLERAGFVAESDDAPDAGSRPAREGPSRTVAYAFGTRDDEARWVLARVASALDAGVPAASLSLVVADPVAEAPRLEALAWELAVPLRVRRPMPLSSTAVGGFLAQTADAIDRSLPYEATLQALRHRLAGGMTQDAFDAARIARPVGATAWSGVDARAELLDWPGRARRERFVELLTHWLERLGLPHDELPPHEIAALELVLRALVDGRPEGATVERRAFLTDLRDLLDLLTVGAPAVALDGPRGASGPVEVGTPADAAERPCARSFVLGLSEGVLPPDLRDPAVLDVHDRRTLRAAGVDLPLADEQARASWSAFAGALRAAREEAFLGVPTRSGGGVALPSPYLARMGLVPLPAPVRGPASPEERRRLALLARGAADGPSAADASPSSRTGDDRRDPDPVLAQALRAWRVERRRESAEPPDRHDGVTGLPMDLGRVAFSATRLQAIGRCGFRFFARYRLGLTTFEESDERITPVVRGRLWHGALERAVRRATGLEEKAGADRASADAVDDAAVDAELRARVLAELPTAYRDAERELAVPDPDGHAWRRVRAGEIRALERLVRSEAFLAPGHRPRAVERPFVGRWRGLDVRGVVDRVDVGPDRIELIDYKSGTSAPKDALDEDRRSWFDVQLPLYLEAAAPGVADELGLDLENVQARYLSVRSGETLRAVEPGQYAAELDRLVARVRRLAGVGAWPVDPDERREACGTCDFASVCRVGPRIERKRDAALAEAS